MGGSVGIEVGEGGSTMVLVDDGYDPYRSSGLSPLEHSKLKLVYSPDRT